ncbi:conserved hypothetical protein [Ricinus communis]|uniref:Uncharacterized protein n=1 Tax=Ricinus communis TaxID=3988 RepID=B9T2X2_RICCO|nr:conserved hypothetical protein [Ricinus communis]
MDSANLKRDLFLPHSSNPQDGAILPQINEGSTSYRDEEIERVNAEEMVVGDDPIN